MMLLSWLCITYECRKLDRNVSLLKRKTWGFYIPNREKMGSPAHLDVMENMGRMYVNPYLIRVFHFCYLWLQFFIPCVLTENVTTEDVTKVPQAPRTKEEELFFILVTIVRFDRELLSGLSAVDYSTLLSDPPPPWQKIRKRFDSVHAWSHYSHNRFLK